MVGERKLRPLKPPQRSTAVLTGAAVDGLPELVLYDGRPDAASNWQETTGLAAGPGDQYIAAPGELAFSACGRGAALCRGVVAARPNRARPNRSRRSTDHRPANEQLAALVCRAGPRRWRSRPGELVVLMFRL